MARGHRASRNGSVPKSGCIGLGTLRAPRRPRLRNSRLATEDDRGLLVEWVELFFEEAFSHLRDDGAGERFVDNAKRVGDRFVLWDVDGTPVSMAMLRAPRARTYRGSGRSSRR